MMRRTMFGVIILAAFCAPLSQADLKSVYYLTAGDQKRLTIISGETFTQHSQGHTGNKEYPIAVNGQIVTAGCRSHDQPGGYYDLSGGYLEPAGTWTTPSGTRFYDGTTDGTFNYACDYEYGGVYQFDTDWSGGSLLFPLSEEYIGITYDPVADTFWVSDFHSNIVEQRNRDGSLISSFGASVFSNRLTCLALDHADRTLWFGCWNEGERGVFAQYTLDGTLLDTIDYGFSDNTLGGEFDFAEVPEPATILLLGLGASLLRRRRGA